jgi:hypothetical protein
VEQMVDEASCLTLDLLSFSVLEMSNIKMCHRARPVPRGACLSPASRQNRASMRA